MKNDPKQALRIAKQALAKPNPSPQHMSAGLHRRISIHDMCQDMLDRGVNVSSLTENDWLDLFVAHGASEDEAIRLYENMSAWSVTDEV